MSELTGDAPLSAPTPSKPPAPSAAAKAAAAKPMPNFDNIDLEVDDAPEPPPSRPPPPPKASRPPPPPKSEPPPPPADNEPHAAEARSRPPPPPPPDESEPAVGPVKIGAVKTALKDPFEGMNLGEPGTGAIELATQPKRDKIGEAAKADTAKAEAAKGEPAMETAPIPEIPPGRDMVSSALTGLVGAALAIAFVIVAALSDDASAGWLGLGHGSDVVATRVVSGLYDTASGKQVFFVRGRIENRGKKIRGPVKVTAELVSEGAPAAHAEAIAGAEPSAEDIWSLRSQADLDKLTRTLNASESDRKLQPGTSLPFFAVIPDPPPDLQRHRLHVKVESVDAWSPPPSKAGKGR